MYRLRTSALFAAAFLAGCPAEPVDKDDTDTDTEVIDTDTEVIDTEVDTEADTDVIDTDDGVIDTTIRDLRLNTSGNIVEGVTVRVRNVVVVAVRTEPSNERAFVVQDGTSTNYDGIYVKVDAGASLPAVGDALTIVGHYVEDRGTLPTAVVPSQTRATLEVLAAQPLTSWTRTGAGVVPTPRQVDVATYLGTAELYESMLVRLRGAAPLEVTTPPPGAGTFRVRQGVAVTTTTIGSHFFPVLDLYPDLKVGDTFTNIDGVGVWADGRHSINPLAAIDLVGFVAADTDVPVDTDETDLPVDTDDTDIVVVDTDDTFMGADTDPDTDPDTDVDPWRNTTTTFIRNGVHSPGQLLRLPGLIVTGVRFRVSPPASNAFSVQDPNESTKAGLWVFVGSSTALPAIGDEVDLIGVYEESPTSAAAPNATRSQLLIEPSRPLTSITIVSSGNPLPAPVPVTLATLQSFTTAEPLESMLVRLEEPTRLDVISNPLTNGDFRVSTAVSVAEVFVEEELFDLRSVHAVNNVDELDALIGVVHFEVNAYKLAPTVASDAINYTDN